MAVLLCGYKARLQCFHTKPGSSACSIFAKSVPWANRLRKRHCARVRQNMPEDLQKDCKHYEAPTTSDANAKGTGTFAFAGGRKPMSMSQLAYSPSAGPKPPIEPMLAKLADALPAGGKFLYEPKWDGFRAIVFRDAADVFIQSRD